MFCPKCHSEYREGFNECPTCNMPLIEQLPQEEEPEFINFVTVYKTSNPAIIAFAKSILESESIVHYIKGEGLQDLFAAGRIGTGFNPLVGVTEIQVDKNDLKYAKQLLEQIEETHNEETEEEYSYEEQTAILSNSSISYFVKEFLAGILISGIVFFLYNWKKTHITNIVEYDLNKDSISDVFYFYENGVIVKEERDRNYDGKIDNWGFFVEGLIDKSESDNNFDGITDTWYTYKNGIITHEEVDINDDDKADTMGFYKHGIFIEQEWYDNSRNLTRKRAIYKLGIKREELIDNNLDGEFDVRIIFDSLEQPVSKINLNCISNIWLVRDRKRRGPTTKTLSVGMNGI